MISFLSEKMSYSFIASGIVAEEDQAVYAYSFEVLFSTLLNFFALCLMAVVTGRLTESICFLLAFIPLRQVVGGYHAKNHLRCFGILMAVYLAFLWIAALFPYAHIDTAVLICLQFSVFIIFRFAPVGDPNKPLSEKEIIRFKRKSRIAIVSYASITGWTCFCIQYRNIALYLALGILLTSLSLAAGVIKRSFTEHSLP